MIQGYSNLHTQERCGEKLPWSAVNHFSGIPRTDNNSLHFEAIHGGLTRGAELLLVDVMKKLVRKALDSFIIPVFAFA